MDHHIVKERIVRNEMRKITHQDRENVSTECRRKRRNNTTEEFRTEKFMRSELSGGVVGSLISADRHFGMHVTQHVRL